MANNQGKPAESEEQVLGSLVIDQIRSQKAAESGKLRATHDPREPDLLERDLQEAFAQRISANTGSGSDADLQRAQQLYHKIRSKQLARSINRPNRDPRAREKTILEMASYSNLIHLDEQVSRLFQDYRPSLFASLGGFSVFAPIVGRTTRDTILFRSKMYAVDRAVTSERPYLADTETQALIEEGLRRNDILAFGTLLMLSSTAWFSWRGRRTFRFPFYSPSLQTRFNPMASPRLRLPWQAARVFSYYVASAFAFTFVFPPVMEWRTFTMEDDPRLKNLPGRGPMMIRGNTQPGRGQTAGGQVPSTAQVPEAPQEFGEGFREAFIEATESETKSLEGLRDAARSIAEEQKARSKPQTSFEYPQEGSNGEQEAYQQSRGTFQASQNSYKAPSNDSSKNDSWDAPIAGLDDASPVASAARPTQGQQSSSSTPGSAWARLRQQENRSGQGQQGQDSRSSPQSSESAWGSNAGTSPDYRGPRESYSFSEADEEKASPKTQGQREFDQLLEQERKGVDQRERTSWSGK